MFEIQAQRCAPQGQPATAQGAALDHGPHLPAISPNGARCPSGTRLAARPFGAGNDHFRTASQGYAPGFCRSAFQAAISLAALLVVIAPALADENETDDPKLREQRLAVMKDQAAAYTLTLKNGAKLALHDEPVLRFSNPVSGVPDGIVAMWKDGKRPAVFAQVFQTKSGLWVHEVQSLASAGLTMVQGDKTFWQPQEPYEAFRRLDDAPPAAANAGRRLVQMKVIAAEFSAADDFKINAGDKETTRHALRMLPTPIYRYDDPDAGVEDGTVFAFVHGTDPEVFLVLESRAEKAGTPGWHYTLAPMTCWAVMVQHDGNNVWSLPERLNKSKPNDLYHVWLHRPAK